MATRWRCPPLSLIPRSPNGPTEKRGILRYNADLAPELGQREIPDVDTIQHDPAPIHVPEPRQQRDQGRLAAAGWTDQSQRLAGSAAELDVFQRPGE
jgi:hypothetical protein